MVKLWRGRRQKARPEAFDEVGGRPARLAARSDADRFDGGLRDEILTPRDTLGDDQPRTPHRVVGGADGEGVVDAGGLAEVDGEAGDHEGAGIGPVEKIAVADAGEPQIVRSPALKVADVV